MYYIWFDVILACNLIDYINSCLYRVNNPSSLSFQRPYFFLFISLLSMYSFTTLSVSNNNVLLIYVSGF